MIGKDAFSAYHPLVNMTWFLAVMVFSMIFMHPICLAVSLICSFAYMIKLNGRRGVRFILVFMLPLLLLTVVLNPAFNHKGATIITYLPSGNPLTLESIVFGIAAAVMLIALICWFACYNAVMTSDKFIYLFGRVIPGLSLVLSMTLRFVPRFKAQLKAISAARTSLEGDLTKGSLLKRARRGMTLLSALLTWALENAVDTADSMRARGYGLPGRTAFSIYRFDGRDGAAMAFILCCIGYIIAGAATGQFAYSYYPLLQFAEVNAYSVSVFAVYAALALLPLMIDIREDRKWLRLSLQD
ncbi:MAG: energy-coupling factor transporter transmembrane protein EcfT [Firmicutes bacterium]|nr:energy-coupling factor transporter transmembrane protein EcfT [Bacillota bacterium]